MIGRLKKRLNLPNIVSHPPCSPRVYKKLYKYLDAALPASTSTPNTPRKSTAQASTSTPSRTTPKTPLSARKTPRSGARHIENKPGEAELPDWTMPTIRTLVRAFDYPTAASHVYTAVESTLPLLARMTAASARAAAETPSKRPRRAAAAPQLSATELSDAKRLALIAVTLFYVLSRMMDRDISPEQFLQWRERAISTLLQSKAGQDGGINVQDLEAEIEILMPMAQEEGWLNMEWFVNVLPLTQNDEMEDIEMEDGDIQRTKKRGLEMGTSEYIGLGTMMQEDTDYLGERQTAEYERWKKSFLAKVAEIETAS